MHLVLVQSWTDAAWYTKLARLPALHSALLLVEMLVWRRGLKERAENLLQTNGPIGSLTVRARQAAAGFRIPSWTQILMVNT